MDSHPHRRQFLATSGTLLSAGLAGCPLLGTDGGAEGDPATTGTPSDTPTREPTATLQPTQAATTTPESTPSATPAPSAASDTLVPRSDDGATAYGGSVALSGETAIVGAHAQFADPMVPPATVFEYTDGDWRRTATLVPAAEAVTDWETWKVDVDRDVATVVGQEAVDGEYRASAYAFRRDAEGTWNQVDRHRFAAWENREHFGRSVAVSGGRTVVGFTVDYTTMTDNRGAASILAHSDDGWGAQVILPEDGGSAPLGYGHAVAVDEDVAVVGTWEGNEAVVYEHDERWNERDTLSVENGRSFGTSVAVAGDVVLVGDPDGTTPNGPRAGVVHVFESGDEGWTHAGRLFADGGTDDDRFGSALAFTGETALVGAVQSMGGTGYAVRFERDDAGWRRVERFRPPDGDSGDRFGAAVAITDRFALVGASADQDPANTERGAAYVFEL